MGEGVFAYDCLVRLDLAAREHGELAAGREEHFRVDGSLGAVKVRPRFKGHHDLLKRRVARTLPYSVDRDVDSVGTRFYRRESVGCGESEVVVAVDRQLVGI